MCRRRPSSGFSSLAIVVASSAQALEVAVAPVEPPAATASAPASGPAPVPPGPSLEAAPASAVAPAPAAATSAAAQLAPAEVFTFGGYVESYYQWNFNDPDNGITHFRGFDNRHNAFTISNVALTAAADVASVVGKLTLQVGATPSTYYLAEPSLPGAAATNASNLELWKYIQEALAGYRFPVLNGLLVQGGIFLSPIGPEGVAVKDNWTFSRSHLFFGLPFYHTGVRATLSLTDHWAATVAVVNGWNSVVDNNDEKSLYAQINFTLGSTLATSLLYFGGVERAPDAPEGRAWRNTFDAHATWAISDALAVQVHGDVGFEPNEFGTSWWAAGHLGARYQLLSFLYVAARGDYFYEGVAENASGSSSSIFWPVPWVTSGTVSIDARPHDHVSFRLDYRHDHAEGDMFFRGEVDGDGVTAPFVPDASFQDTVTLGAVVWF